MANQVQHCIIGDGLEATLLALSLVRLKQTVALVQTTRPVLESFAVAVAELNPNLAPLHIAAHHAWPQLAGCKPVQWRVQGMAVTQQSGGIIHTVAALGSFIREFRGLGGDYMQVDEPTDITLTTFEGRLTGVNLKGEHLDAGKIILANGLDAYDMAKAINIYLPLQAHECYSVGFSYTEQVMVPPIAVKLPHGHVYIFSDGPQHIQALYTGSLGQNHDVVTLLQRLVVALLPKLTWQPHDQVRSWPYATSTDGLPLVGPVTGVEGLWLCNGLKEHATFLAPALAANLAEALCDRPTNPAMNDLMPARILRVAVAQRAGGEVTEGEKHLVAAPELTHGEEHFGGGVDLVKGEKRLIDAPHLTTGEERFVDATGSTVIRNSVQMAEEEKATLKMGENAPAKDAKVQVGSLKTGGSNDKKVTVGSLKK